MTIQEVQAATADLAAKITQLVQDFQSTTGTLVHSIPVEQEGKVHVRVKVQIP
jgi:hypothetical protein